MSEPKRLPRHYWPMYIVSLLVIMVLAGGIVASLELNPYVGAAVAGVFWGFREMVILKREGY